MRRKEVLTLDVEPRQPFALPGTGQLRPRFLGKRDVVVQVVAARFIARA